MLRTPFGMLVISCILVASPAFGQNLALSQPGLGFSALVGGPNPAPQSVSVTSAPAVVNWTITSAQPA